MLSMDPDGYLYPCIRYMESSLGTDRPPLRIGHVNIGIAQTECDKKCVDCLNKIDRRTESTDECFYCPIAEGCSWCFPAGTKITTPNGLVNIEELCVGDRVIDKDGDVQTVEKNLERKTDELIYVKATGLPDLLTTKEHPFWAKPVISKKGNLPIYGDPRWIPAGELRKTDRIALFIPEIGTKDVDKNFAYIIGRYVGDGWKTPSGRNKHPYQYYICTPFDEAESFEKYLNNANIKYSRYKNKTVEEFRLSISGDDYLVEILDDCGRYAKDKHVPNDVKFWNRESIIAFLNGYFAADGSYDKRHSVRRFSSISYELILGISELVRMVYHKNVNVTKRIPNPVGVIDGRKINQSVSYEGRYYETEPQRKYYEYDDELHVMWVNVSESKLPVPKFQYVYNLTVSNTHSYIANGAIVHNCSAYNYQENGTPDSRCTYICDMHKARSLANAYFWNTWYRKTNKPERFEIHCPDEWAIPIIGEEELNRLKDLAKEDY